jgi:hypothetical protein
MFPIRGTAFVVVTAVLALGTAAAQSGQAQRQCPQYTQRQAVQGGTDGAAGPATPSGQAKSRTDLSNEAVEMLINALHARQALANDNTQAALRQIDEALCNAQRLSEVSSARFVPIYTEYSQTSVIAPIEAARVQQGERTRVAAPVVREVEGRYTNIAVDVPAVERRLQAARTALLNNNQDAADSALRAVQSGVVLVRIESDLPLVKARQNLALAKGMVRQGNFQAARLPLRQAVNALGNYSGAHAEEAEQLQLQIARFMTDFPGNRQIAANQIDNWWNELAGWTTAGSAEQQVG